MRPAGNGFFESLDFTHSNRDGKAVVFPNHDVGGRCTAIFGTLDDLFNSGLEIGHYFSVPPTVISRILVVGRPTLTGMV
jgi:hypothetical protein